jgi:acetyl esterase/lipase
MAENEPGRVTVEEGVVIGSSGGRALRADVYTPPGRSGGAPGILLIHGGGWYEGDRSQLKGYGILLGRKGYLTVACEYRLTGEAKWPAQVHDVKAALRWMRSNAGSLGIDPGRIAVSGNSAGGHLSLIVAGTPNLPEFEGDGGNPGVDTSVAAAIAFYPPTHIVHGGRAATSSGPPANAADAFARLMGDGATQEACAAASPITHSGSSFPPTMLIHGTDDAVVDEEESLSMYRALRSVGAPVELHTFAGQPHGFDAAPALGRQCADLMAVFLERYVPARAAASV